MFVEPIRDKKIVSKFLTYLKGTNKRDWLLAKFQLNTGLRISDVVDVKVSDLLTGKNTKIKLNEDLKKAVKSFIQENNLDYSEYIFFSRKAAI